MPNEKLEMYVKMAEDTARSITWNMAHWTAFLQTAARLYKYPFQEQLLIFAQRPDATACADYNTWNQKMRRYVRRGGHGIALIDESGGEPRLKYVFDVLDTGGGPDSLSPYLWEYRSADHFARVSDALTQRFGVPPVKGEVSLLPQLRVIFLIQATTYWENNLSDILRIVDKSLLSGYTEDEIKAAFLNAAVESATFMTAIRCGLRQEPPFSPAAFHRVAAFNTPEAVRQLGKAINESGEQVLRTIEAAVKQYERERLKSAERSVRHDRTEGAEVRHQLLRGADQADGSHDRPGERSELSSGGRGLDSGHRAGVGADGGRPTDVALGRETERLPEGASFLPVSGYADDRGNLEAHAGRAGAGTEPTGHDDSPDGGGAGRDRGAEEGRAASLGRDDEQHQGQRGGDDLRGSDLRISTEAKPVLPAAVTFPETAAGSTVGQQLALFPTEAEQLQMIQEKAESVPATPFAFSCPQEVIDDFLRFGSNTTKSREHIIAALYPWHTPETDWLTEKARETFTNILRREYHGGYGLIVDGVKYAAWFDKQGLRVSRGTSARNVPFAQTIPWNDVLERVWHLYGDGKFSTNVEAVEAHGNECRELALSLLYLYHDRSKNCPENLLSSLKPFLGGGYSDEQARLAEALADANKASAIKAELDAFVDVYHADPDLLRFHYHKLPELQMRFRSLLVSWDHVITQTAAELSHTPFITEDEIDEAVVVHGSGFSGGRQRVYAYFTAGHDAKEKSDFLKNEYGTGGRSHALSGADNSWEDHDGKGLRFKKGDCPEVTISWPNVAKRIETLIHMNRYLTPEEQAREAEIRDAHYEPEESEILPGDDSEQDAPRQDTPAQPSDADPTPMAGAAAEKEAFHDTKRQPAPTPTREMTPEEIDDALRAWNGRIESKRAVVRYMKEHGRDREAAAWLAREFGIEPETPLILINLDASAETAMPWTKVQRRLMQLIRSEMFFTEDEYDRMEDVDPVVIREQLEQSGIVNGALVNPEALDNNPFIQQVMADAERIATEDTTPVSTELDEATPSLPSPRWLVDVGDTVYLEDGKAFLVENHSDREIRLRDPSLVYPIFRVESFESFQRLLERYPQPGITDNVPVSADAADVSYAPVVVSSDGPSEVVAIQTIRHGEPQEPIRVLPENYRITDDHLGEGGPKAKFRANMDAIAVLKQVEAEGRNATPEEQETLARYVGWGGLADAFDAQKTDWSKEYSALKDALTPEEYAAARASTLNAHYTSPTVIRAIYEALSNMGFTSGNILEPACGVGNFFGMLPQEMSASKLYGVELDSVSGRIAKLLYPNANITVAGFETTDRRDFYDVAIGNVPFGQYQVNDRAYNKLGFSIHNYFFAKALDQVRAGGIVAFITSRYTMDAKDSTMRRYLAQRAELLGAIRLPNNAFKANAGTEVVSDILFLQKRDRPSLEEPDWLFTAKNIPDSALGKVGDVITFTTGYPRKEYTAEITEVGSGYANVPYYRGKNSEQEFRYISASNVSHIERKSDFVYEINQYFLQHPEMVLGNPTSESTQYGRQDYTVAPADGLSLADQLRTAVGRIRASYFPLEFPDVADEATPVETIPADPTVRNFTYTLLDGVLWFRENSVMRKQTGLPATTEARIKGMVELRECMRTLLDLELDDDVTDTEIQEKQAELSKLYDAFSASFGSINDRKNEAAFSEDSSYFLLCSLEETEKDGKTYRKATDIFTKRTIKQRRTIDHVDTAAEALAVSIGQRAAVDLPFMAQLMGDHEKIAQIVDDLHGVIFKSPDTGPFDYADGGEHWDKGWQTADEYLSGNVRKKLLQAETAAKSDPFFEINVEALTRAQPKELEATDIDVRLGSTWIAPEIFEQFMLETFQTPKYLQDSMRVRFSPYSGEWFIDHKTYIGKGDMIATSTYGTSRANAYEILEDCLNLRDVRIYDKDDHDRRILNGEETELAAQKQQAIRDAFQDWIWKDPKRREKLVRQYNEEMNSTRPREYDGKHLVFSGMNPEIALREHQVNAIAHVIYGGNTLLAHEVGAGKTFEMVAAAMESKRLGLCSKSLFVVPNHLVNQWASEFLRLYPAANLLVTTKRDFEPARRKKFCARIAAGDYDAIIMGQSQFEKIPVSQERQQAFLTRQIEEITAALEESKAARGDRFSIKQIENTKRNLESKLEKLQGSDRKDDVVTFEQLGVDRLFVDESDNYKNLFLYTKMRNVAGLSTSDAQKSSDMFAKCRYLDELTNNRGVIFATGTPISNSMTEMYTIHRYLQYDRLQEMGMGLFDSWASRFGETTTKMELTPEGTGYRPRTRFARFFNVPELMTFFREVADIKTADQLNLPTPEVEFHNIVAQPTEIQRDMMKTLSQRASRVHSGKVDPKDDNMLKITSDGRKLGLDQRLIDPMLPDAPGTKVNLCVENVLKYWREGEAEKLTQLVFCDISTPTQRSSHGDPAQEDGAADPPFTNIYEDIRRKLIKGGMPAEQIAFIHDADTEKRKEELFSKMRSGEVRVLLGSTAKMGAGTNVQDRLIASHDLDCPWRPRDLTQRKGRIERQGNQNTKVHVCRYVTEATFDAYLWQTVENKQLYISQIMTSKSPARTCEDMDETVLSFAEVKALCAGDPRIKERMDLDVEVKRLRILKSAHNSKKYQIQDMLLRYYPAMIETTQAEIRGLTRDLQTVKEHPLPEGAFVGMDVRGDRLSDKKNAGAALISACREMVSKSSVKIGSYRGFDILASYDTWERQYVLNLKGGASHRLVLGADPLGNITRMENALAKIPSQLETAKAELENYLQQKEAAASEVDAVFPFEQELAEKAARLIALDHELSMDADRGQQPEPDRKKRHEEVL